MKRLFPLLLLLCAAPLLPHETLTTTVLFDREIVRILDKHCVMCHAENGPSFPLETYEQTWLKKRPIHDQAIARHMPPWPAVPGYGQFLNDNSLTLRETQFIVSWVEGLGPRNSGTVFLNVAGPDATRPPEVRAHPSYGHWQLGEPQLTRQFPASVIEPRSTSVRRLVVDLGLKADRQLRALEYMPGDRRVARAVFFTVQETGQWIGSWTPWFGYQSLPAGLAYRIPAGAHVIAEIHYSGVQETFTERGTLGLFFDDKASTVSSDLVLNANLIIGPQPKVRGSTKLLRETKVLALWPTFPSGTTSIEVSARKPDGSTEVLLFAKDLRADWPTPFILQKPITLPRGTELAFVAYTDNSHGEGFRLTVNRVESSK